MHLGCIRVHLGWVWGAFRVGLGAFRVGCIWGTFGVNLWGKESLKPKILHLISIGSRFLISSEVLNSVAHLGGHCLNMGDKVRF